MSELNDAMDWIGLDARAHIESGDASVSASANVATPIPSAETRKR